MQESVWSTGERDASLQLTSKRFSEDDQHECIEVIEGFLLRPDVLLCTYHHRLVQDRQGTPTSSKSTSSMTKTTPGTTWRRKL